MELLMTTDNDAYAAYSDTGTTAEGDLAELSRLAEDQVKAEKAVADAEAALVKAQQSLKDISERKLPELMDKLGMAEFKTTSGAKVEIDEQVRASIPATRKFEAFAWLRTHNSAALIKRSISVDFSKGEDEKADKLLKQLKKDELEAEDKESVHSSTLKSWVTKKLEKGEEFPLDLFGVFRQRVSKVSTPK